jgi:drug/metabolite transporter (DMT)-like permease
VTAKSRAEWILLGITVIWGTTFALGKVVLEEVTPLQMISFRFTLSTILLLALFPRSIFPLRLDQALKGGLLGLFLFLGFVVQTIGLSITSASKSAFVTGMTVVFVPLFQIIVSRRAPKFGNILGVLIVTLGLWFLTSPEGAAFNAGDALTLACAVLFGMYMVYLDVVSREMSAVQLTFLQVGTNALLGIGAMSIFESAPLHITPFSWLALVYLAIFATVITTFTQTKYQKDTTPTRAAIIFTMEPVFASVIAALFLGEQLGLLGITGGALIIAGVLVSELSDFIPFLNRSLGTTES